MQQSKASHTRSKPSSEKQPDLRVISTGAPWAAIENAPLVEVPNATSMELVSSALVGAFTSLKRMNSGARPSFSRNLPASSTAPKPTLKPLVQ